MRWSLIRYYGCSLCSNLAEHVLNGYFSLYHLGERNLFFIRFIRSFVMYLLFRLIFSIPVYLRLLRTFGYFTNLSSQVLLVVTGIIANEK